MVKCQVDWNSYYANNLEYEDYELEELYCMATLMEVFALKFDFGPKMQAQISGEITIRDYPLEHMLFTTSTDDFLLMKTGKFTEAGGGMKLPISGIGPAVIRLDLVDKSYGNLKFESRFGFQVVEEDEDEEEEEEEEQKKKRTAAERAGGDEEEKGTAAAERAEGGGDEEEKGTAAAERAEGGGDEEEKGTAAERAGGGDEEEKGTAAERAKEEEKRRTAAKKAEARKLFDLWDCFDYFYEYKDKLLCKKFTSPYCSLEVLYAVYKDARAVSVEVKFAGWNRSYFTDPCTAMSDGMQHVFGQVTARNTFLTHPDATTTLFGKEIDEDVIIKLGDLIPLSRTFVVFPRKSSLLLDIDLRHVLRNVPLSDPKVPPSSELFVKTTLEVTDPHCSQYRYIVKDSGPAILYVDVDWDKLSSRMLQSYGLYV